VDADQILKRLDALDEAVKSLREALSAGLTPNHVPVDFDIGFIRWMKRDREPAAPGATWAWAFGFDRNGNPVDPALIDALKRRGKIRVGPYEVTLGGHDRRLLNRRKIE